MKNNFAVLLAERKLKITKVAEDTGISRQSLTEIFYHRSKQIRFDTLFKICEYLNCTPNDLLLKKEVEGWK